MEPIYVIGHRNPDTDSIVSAMAYAALRNACGHREYEAGRLGQISAETRIVLDRFGFQPPRLIHDVFTQASIMAIFQREQEETNILQITVMPYTQPALSAIWKVARICAPALLTAPTTEL